MKVFVVRHGESETNRDGLWTGWMDVALTQKGREDAALARNLLSLVKFDKIYASDLQRAKCTAEIAIPGCRYETSALLREINVGDIAGKPLHVVKDCEGKPLNKDGYACFGGETRAELRGRVKAFMQELEVLECQNVAVFAHAGVLKTFLDVVLDVTVPGAHICCRNCTVAIFEYDAQGWKLHSWINLS